MPRTTTSWPAAARRASVLLIERGGPALYTSGNRDSVAWNDTVTLYDVPGLVDYMSLDPDLKYCKDVAIAAGCAVGGSTMLNAMMFVKPRAADFESWPEEWHWANGVAEAAEELYEREPGTTLASRDGKRYDDAAFEIVSRFLAANGYSETDALRNPEDKELIYTHPPWAIANGLRDSPARSILPDAQALPNFKLEVDTKVIRAVRSGGRVTGVEVELATGRRETIKLNRGGSLVLAAGSHSTPRILFNSGIGPAEQIQTVRTGSVNVTLPPREQWIDLPVGENLQDHAIASVSFNTTVPLITLPSTAWTDPSQRSVDLFAHSSGLLAQSAQRLTFWTSVDGSDGVRRHVQGTVRADANNTIGIKVYLTHGTTSTGTLAIRPDGSTYMPKRPLLNTPADVEALTSYVDSLLAMARRPGSLLRPVDNSTAAELVAAARSGSHYLGTTRMGVANDGSSVVDPDTRVWGTDNLFVVDGSMHPHVPTGNTATPIMVAANYAAKRILQLHRSA
ncbi:cellobiose dehydrogenase (acceptor) [Geosmithia morbida]|uniref:Cellobiose dehydrogenase (Acceptor) n=1 Tax=Geosmithia morbida TaxID=1094350 RepID=A0A9P4YXX0_9HYPO|nr:cellobiose dehydrogenase (acceptor) [Geosmithia morbida]KAF4124890.1 cellobiose dehydrogenase (acceptor) [Geosmithia morbida]